jgi:hypothetical protein
VEPPEETGEDRTILYDIPSSNVIEFRGVPFEVTLSAQDINYLLADNIDICHEEEGSSVLKAIMVGHMHGCARSPSWVYKDNILGYIRSLLSGANPNGYRRIITNYMKRLRTAESRQTCENDLTILRDLVTSENPTVVVRWVPLIVFTWL